VSRITIEEARALADQWKAQREDAENAPNASYFRDATPHELIAMLETGKGTDGKRLTKREFGCLIERWCEVFGALPAGRDDRSDDIAPTSTAKPEPLPADDTMLRASDVERLTGISHSTIKRMVSDGRFPRPMRIGERAKGWPARDIKAFIDTLDQQRQRPKH
jgi:prophage regulatory protein